MYIFAAKIAFFRFFERKSCKKWENMFIFVRF